MPAGLGFGIGQHYRFAAAEVATPGYRPRAISLVMTGGVLSAALGPEIVQHTRDMVPPPPRSRGGAPVREIIARPAFIAAAVTWLVAFGTMNPTMMIVRQQALVLPGCR